jgi:P2 family phage contractile tail tube protein
MAAEDIIKYLNLVIDGRGYAGKLKEWTPPTLATTNFDFRGGGMDAPVDVETGMEKLTFSGVLTSYDADVLALWGLKTGAQTQLTARGSMESLDGTVKPVVHNMTGKILSLARGTWGPGNEPALTITGSLTFYREIVNGRVVHEIDVINMVRFVDGVDQLAAHRKNLGI